MAKDPLSGKLAVILHGDIAGSTKMVQQDEHLAHERIQETFHQFSETIEEYSGQVLELRGDALLAEFERPSDAVSATLAFQSRHLKFLTSIGDEIKPEVRVGISMGEVVVADNTITGAGVVMAQRVEQLAEPGGACITSAVQESLSKRVPIELVNLGEQDLKGFDEPIRVFKVILDANQSVPLPQLASSREQPKILWKQKGLVALLALAIVVGIVYWVNSGEQLEEKVSVEQMAFPLPEKPSIAVLPFTNMSDDAEQEYFVDGMTEDLITDLSKLSELFVVARNSVFTYKGRAVKVRDVAEELGVRYVLEGSVRRSGDQVRINAQLIDALSGGHIWAERYDGVLGDVFALQDQVTRGIVSQLAVSLSIEENIAISQTESADSNTYDLFLQGWEHYRSGKPENYTRAIELLEKVIDKDPSFRRAQAALAAVYWDILNKWWWQQSLETPYYPVFERARTALQRSQQDPTALTHQLAAEWIAYYSRSSTRRALVEAEMALKLGPNHPASHMAMAISLLKDRRPQEAENSVRKAMRLDPHYPAAYLVRLAQTQFHLENYQGAADSLQEAVDRNSSDSWAYVYLAAALGNLNQSEKAREALKRADTLRANAGFGPITLVSTAHQRFRWQGKRDALKDGLRVAGAPKGAEWLKLITQVGDIREVKGATAIDAVEAKALHDRGAIFIDTQPTWLVRRIPGAHFLEWWGIEGWMFNEVALRELADTKQEIVIYSSRLGEGDFASASALAVSRGFENVYYFPEALDAWEAAGYPIETGK